MLTLDEKDFKDILNGLVDGVITINQEGIILSFNKTAETIFGYKSEETVGKNVSILMPEPEQSAHNSYLDKYKTTGEEHIIGIGRDVTALKKNGETFPMHLSVIEYPSKIEGDRWFIGSCRDITMQKQQEEQLRRSLKMEAIGKLTSGIAHDYNNKLGIILGYSELLFEQAKNHPKILRYIKEIMHATEGATSLTQKLLSITRKRAESAKIININDLLKNDQQLLAKTLTPKIKLSIKQADGLWDTFIDKGCLEDAILNLSINAMHVMPEGGELYIVTSNIQVGSLDAQVLSIPPGDYVKLSIRDTGTGMSDDIVAHIFEPFFSTKGEKGTGLGLSQVYNFVTESKGTIRVYSETGYGTCFAIYLPRVLRQLSNNETDNSDEDNVGDLKGSARILVVDDERAFSDFAENILSSYGYTVFSASSAKEALAILEDGSIDLVLSDVIMSDMDGFELAHIIHYTHPDVKIQLCSGFEHSKEKSFTNKILSEKLLTKPFTTKQLLINIKDLLRK